MMVMEAEEGGADGGGDCAARTAAHASVISTDARLHPAEALDEAEAAATDATRNTLCLSLDMNATTSDNTRLRTSPAMILSASQLLAGACNMGVYLIGDVT